jgi:hypothetical protein
MERVGDAPTGLRVMAARAVEASPSGARHFLTAREDNRTIRERPNGEFNT